MWALAIWPLLCVGFYLADHTVVQTRYCLLSMPALSIVTLWLLDTADRPALLKVSAAAMLLAALASIAMTVVPHVENKKQGVAVFAQVSAYLRDHVPHDAPVAVFAIGEIAFESRHPLVDIGGITRPGVIPYMNDPSATLQWAKRNGARYVITGEPPEAGAVPLFSTTMPFFGWTFNHARYRSTEPFVVYALP